MKRALHILAVFSLFIYGCNKVPEAQDAEILSKANEVTLVKGQVEFGFNSLLSATGKTTSKGIQSKSSTTTSTIRAQASAVLLSIVDASDNPVYTNTKLELVRVEEDILSLPLSFTPGEYKIVLFQVLDASNTAIAMTPQADSALSGLVSDPLTVDFTATEETTERVNLEVLPTVHQNAADFGYSTFSFTEIKLFPFLLSVFTYDTESTNFELTPARVAITHLAQGKTYYQDDYAAETLTFQIPETQSTDVIEIEISKEGYESQTITATIANLKSYFEAVPLGKGPMLVTLLADDSSTDKAYVTEGLVLYYDVADTKSYSNSEPNILRDLSGNDFHANINGANFVEEHQGGLKSNGSGKPYIRVGKNPAYNAIENITLEAWVKRGVHTGLHTTRYQYIFSNTRDCCGVYNGYGFLFNENRLNFKIHISDKNEYFAAKNKGFFVGSINHLVVSFNGSDVSFYVNGKLDSTHKATQKIGTPATYPLTIGNMGTLPRVFSNNGTQYLLRLYDRALDANEILKNYNSSKSRFTE